MDKSKSEGKFIKKKKKKKKANPAEEVSFLDPSLLAGEPDPELNMFSQMSERDDLESPPTSPPREILSVVPELPFIVATP